MSNEKGGSDTYVELSKAFIGCASAIAAACVAGLFALVAVIAPRLPILNNETHPVPTLSSAVLAATATPGPTATQLKSDVVFGPIIFSPGIYGIELNKKPVDAVTRFPEGTTKIYALFRYEGMVKGSQWRWERSLDGKLLSELGGIGWDLAGQGTTWIVLFDDNGIRQGDWEFRLYVDDRIVQKAIYSVEKHQASAPFFGLIRFAEGIRDDKPVSPHKAMEDFKAGIKEVYAFFDAGNMATNLEWRREWYRDGQLLSGLATTEEWDASQTEKDWWVKMFNDSGLASGTYELKLYVEGRLVQLGTFVIE
jgi:hypothetical protein